MNRWGVVRRSCSGAASICTVLLILVHHVRSRQSTARGSLAPDAYETLIPHYYDKYTSPATDTSPAIVYFDMKLLDISSINENDMTFSVESFVTYRWKDWRLRWPQEDDDGGPCWNPPPLNLSRPLNFTQVCSNNYTAKIDRCIMNKPPTSRRLILPLQYLENIWQPDAFFKNAIRSSIHKDWVDNEYLAYYTNDGHIRLFSRFSATFICKFSFVYFPHDIQTCSMRIESLSYDSDLVQFEWCESWAHASSKLDHDIFSLPHFTLAKYEHVACNARVTLGVTSILTMATQYSQSTKNLPPVSYIKSLDIWMITCMVYVFAALLEFAIVYHVHYRRTISTVRGLITPTSTTNGSSQVTQGLGLAVPRLQRWQEAWLEFWRGDTAIDEASRVLFPLTYFSFVIGYFVLLTGSQEKGFLSRGNST